MRREGVVMLAGPVAITKIEPLEVGGLECMLPL